MPGLLAPQFVTLVPSAARIANGNGDAIDLAALLGWRGDFPPSLRVQSDVTAASGTSPSLVVIVEDSVDGGVTWNPVVTFTAQTAVNRAVNNAGPRGDAYPAGFMWPFNARRVRARWTITGTNPSLTFSVKAVLIPCPC